MTDLDFDEYNAIVESEDDSEPVNSNSSFVLCHLEELTLIVDSCKNKELERRDCFLLLVLLSHLNHKTGLAHVSLKYISEQTQVNLSDLKASMSRLKKNLIVASHVDAKSQAKSYMINPFIFSVGGKIKRAINYKKFQSLVNE